MRNNKRIGNSEKSEFPIDNIELLQRNLISRLSLLGVNQISIDLSSGDILMRQHLRYCVNVCT